MDKKKKLSGVVTMEDSFYLEVEIDDITGPNLLSFPKEAYPNLKTGDIVIVNLEREG